MIKHTKNFKINLRRVFLNLTMPRVGLCSNNSLFPYIPFRLSILSGCAFTSNILSDYLHIMGTNILY